MGLLFASASSQYLTLVPSPPVTAVPFTIAAWMRPTTVAGPNAEYCIGMSNSGSDNSFHYIIRRADTGAGFKWAAYSEDTGALSGISAKAGTPTAGQWDFVVGRFVGSSSRWCDVLAGTGGTDHGQSTTTNTPAGINNQSLGSILFLTGGAQAFFDGNVAEFWMTDSDVQGEDAALSDSLLRQLAYGGPFSVPHVASRLVMYRSFRDGVTGSNLTSAYAKRYGDMQWSATNSPIVSIHPPLPYWYARPNSQIRPRAPLWVPPPKPITRRRALFLR